MTLIDTFRSAQDPIYSLVVSELKAGRKRSHWMWFIFPQLSGLGSSDMSQRYGLASIEAARVYASDPVLFDRLMECCDLLLSHRKKPIKQLLGSPDDMKLKSSMTLFSMALPDEPTFTEVLDLFFEGSVDTFTLELLASKQVS